MTHTRAEIDLMIPIRLIPISYLISVFGSYEMVLADFRKFCDEATCNNDY